MISQNFFGNLEQFSFVVKMTGDRFGDRELELGPPTSAMIWVALWGQA